jgi:hypothetical protein
MALLNIRRISACIAGLSLLLGGPASLISPARASGTITNCAASDLGLALLGGGSVVLACDSTIFLTNPIVVVKETVLDGTGHSPVLSTTGATNPGPMFLVSPGVSLTLRGLTLSNGRLVGANGNTNGLPGQDAKGAAIYSDHGNVTIDGCTLSGHVVTGGAGAAGSGSGGSGGRGGVGAGAAIYNSGGTLLATNTTFSGNSASGGTGGTGGSNSTGLGGGDGGSGGNGGSGQGAAIYNTSGGVVMVLDCLFSSNTVSGSAAGVGGIPSGLLGFPGDNGDSGSGFGAAIFNDNGALSVVNSTFVLNSGSGGSGANGAAGTGTFQPTSGSSGGSAQGAGIYNSGGLASLTNCTLTGNSLLGGTGGSGGSGSTFGLTGSGAAGGSGGDAVGAGLCGGPQGTSIIVNCTFSDNSLTGGTGGLGGAGNGTAGNGHAGKTGAEIGGAVYGEGGPVLLKNSILAFSISSPNAGGTVRDAGFNLSSDASPTMTATGSRNQIDPLLGSFTQAGGQVPTITLSSNSPAIDAITDPAGNGAPAFDQRNAARVAPFDIGAYEFDGTSGPTLQARIAGAQMLLSWPAGGYTLQTAATLPGTASWLTVLGQPFTPTGGVFTMSISATNQAGFYRLKKP